MLTHEEQNGIDLNYTEQATFELEQAASQVEDDFPGFPAKLYEAECSYAAKLAFSKNYTQHCRPERWTLYDKTSNASAVVLRGTEAFLDSFARIA